MKKRLALVLTAVLMLTCLTACDRYTGRVAREDENNCNVFTLDEFSGTYKVRLKRTDLDEGCIYFRANLTQGTVSVSYHMGGNTLVHNPEPLFTAEVGKPLDGHNGYIEDGTVSIIFEANEPVTGEVIISFVPIL